MKKEKNNINIYLEYSLDALKSNNQSIANKLSTRKISQIHFQKIIHELKKNRRKLSQKILSLILSTTITITSGLSIPFLSKKISYRDHYKQTIVTYSDQKGMNEREKLIKVKDANKNDEICINVYNSWEKREDGYERVIERYDVSNYNFENIERYLDYNLDFYNAECNTIIEKVDNISKTKIDLIKHTEVEKSTVDTSEKIKYFDPICFIVSIPLLYSMYFFAIFGSMYFSETNLILGQVKEVREILNKIKYNKKLKKYEIEKIKEINDKILKILDNNDELKSEFIKIYELNKDYLIDSEEVYSNYDELAKEINTEHIKKLIKKKI